MLYTNKGQIHQDFLQFALSSFYYSTGLPVLSLSTQGNWAASVPYRTLGIQEEEYLSAVLCPKLASSELNKPRLEPLSEKAALFYYPLGSKGVLLETLVIGPFKLNSSHLRNSSPLPEDVKNIRKDIEDHIQENIIRKGHFHSVSERTEEELISPFDPKTLTSVEPFQIQYLMNLFTLTIQSTYYDPTFINSFSVPDQVDLVSIQQRPSSKIIHHSIDQEEKILQQILTSSDSFTNLAMKHISKLSNLIAPPLAEEPIRSEKNRFIVSATIVSRAAIKLGMPSDLSFSFSDEFILKVEECTSLKSIWDLQMSLFHFYREEVKKLKEQAYFSTVTSTLMLYIDEHVDTNMTLKEISDILGLDYKYASNVFKKDTGMGFNKYVMNRKLEFSKKLLESTDLTVQNISEKLGFNNAYYFTRTFKNTFGISPTEYRKRTLL